ncbi:MAG: class I SAM-dependent methyltransferase [Candidatus Atabeyarchaeum deiterrae]
MIHKGKRMTGGAPHSPYSIHGLGKLFADRIKGSVEDWNELRVLDVGTGSAANAIFLAELVGIRGKVYSIDPSKEVLQNAGKTIKAKGLSKRIKLSEGEAENIPLESSFFDVVVTLMALHHLKSLGKAIKEFGRVLEEKGVFVAVEWTTKASEFIPHPKTDFISPELAKKLLVENGFDITDFEESGYYFFIKAQKRKNEEAEVR